MHFSIIQKITIQQDMGIRTEVLQTSSLQFSVGSLQPGKRVLLKTENPKLYSTGLFAKVLLKPMSCPHFNALRPA
jgi:hypothetical protein